MDACMEMVRRRRHRVDSGLKAETRSRLVSMLYQGGGATAAVGQAAALLVVMVLYGACAPGHLWMWLGFFSITSLAWLLLIYLEQRIIESRGVRSGSKKTVLFAAGALLNGISWAVLPLVPGTHAPILVNSVVVIVLISISAISMVTTALYLPAFYAFNFPIFLSLLYWSLFVAQEANIPLLLLLAGYMAVISFFARQQNRQINESIVANLKQERLANDLAKLNRELREMAFLDPVTNIPNRRWFEQVAEQAVERAKRNRSTIAFALLSIHDFKEIEKRLGRKAAEQLLVHIATQIMQCIRKTDTVTRKITEMARIGGDEFILLLDGIKERENAAMVVRRMFGHLSRRVMVGGTPVHPKLNAGIALYPDDGATVDILLNRADRALYRAKRLGGNKFCFFTKIEGEKTMVWGGAAAPTPRPRG